MVDEKRIFYEKMLHTALGIAYKYHTNVDDSGFPYIFHPIRVMEKVKGTKLKIIAILHDVLEESEVTVNDLRNLGITDEIILDAIVCLTKKPDESYETYLHRINKNPIARRIKLADIEDNLSPHRIYRLSEQRAIKLTKKYLKALKILKNVDESLGNI